MMSISLVQEFQCTIIRNLTPNSAQFKDNITTVVHSFTPVVHHLKIISTPVVHHLKIIHLQQPIT